jgi:hypothetical protein
MLVVLKRCLLRKHEVWWDTRCDCGNTRVVRDKDLQYRRVFHCWKTECEIEWARRVKGAEREEMNPIDETGKRYGALTVIERSGSQDRKATWLTRCDCGDTRVVAGSALRSGEAKSCNLRGCERTGEEFQQESKTMATTNQAHPLQSIMDKLDKQIDAVAKNANDCAARINTLALAYASACREDAMSALAARLTAEPPPPRSADEAALALWEAVRELPEVRRLEDAPVPAAPALPPPTVLHAVPEADYPRVRVACTHKPLVIVGGIPATDRLNWVRNRTVKSTLWAQVTRDRDQRDTDAVVSRVSGREFGAVVIVEMDVRANQRARIETACMRVGVPWVIAESSSTDALSAALAEMERSLGQSVQATR